jgi:hypothetical protein
MSYIDNTAEYKASSKEYLLALIGYSSFLGLLDTSGKPYLKLSTWLLEHEKELNDEDSRTPTVKDISAAIGVEASKIAKHLKDIYGEIHELNEKEPNKFFHKGQKVCDLHFRYFGYSVSFTLGLNELPRVGENFNFDFIYPRTGCRTFYVKRISHFIDNDKQTILISLTGEEENLYLRLLNEKAYLKHDISAMDYINLRFTHDYALQDKLLKLYQHL